MKKVSFEIFEERIREQFGEYPKQSEIRGWYDAIEIPEKKGDHYELKTPHSALLVPDETAVFPTAIEVDEYMILEPLEGAMIRQPLVKGHIVIDMHNIGRKKSLEFETGDVIATGRYVSELDD